MPVFKKPLIWGCCLLMLTGCATTAKSLAAQLQVLLPKPELQPAEVVEVTFLLPENVKKGWVQWEKRTYSMYPRLDKDVGTYSAYIPVPANHKPGRQRMHVFFPYISKANPGPPLPLIQETYEFAILPASNKPSRERVRLKKFNYKRFLKELRELQALSRKSQYRPDKLRDFLLPMGGRRVAGYYTVRTYKRTFSMALQGVEIAPLTTGSGEVKAAAEGQVVLAKKMAMLGNTVMVDHGRSFMTVYAHLRTFNVKTGDHLSRGSQLGMVGRSGGAAVGKRLFYQLFVGGQPVDIEQVIGVDLFE